MKRILVPVDFSLGSRAALRYAVGIAERFGAEVEVIHLWEPPLVVTPVEMPWLAGDTETFWRQLTADLRQRLDQLLADEVPAWRERIAVRVEAGYAAVGIVQHLEKGRDDLVVMGTHGRTGLSHLFLGSVAERVVRASPVPVMTVRVPKELEHADAEARRQAREAPHAAR